jgi:hypothetical protein
MAYEFVESRAHTLHGGQGQTYPAVDYPLDHYAPRNATALSQTHETLDPTEEHQIDTTKSANGEERGFPTRVIEAPRDRFAYKPDFLFGCRHARCHFGHLRFQLMDQGIEDRLGRHLEVIPEAEYDVDLAFPKHMVILVL